MAAIAFNTAQRAAGRLEAVLTAVREKIDAFVSDQMRQAAAEAEPARTPTNRGSDRAPQEGVNMTLLSHTGPLERVPYSSAKSEPTGATNAHLAIIKRVCLITVTSLLAIGAVAGIIALKTVAYLSHFSHLG